MNRTTAHCNKCSEPCYRIKEDAQYGMILEEAIEPVGDQIEYHNTLIEGDLYKCNKCLSTLDFNVFYYA